jgi:hypothetical protein
MYVKNTIKRTLSNHAKPQSWQWEKSKLPGLNLGKRQGRHCLSLSARAPRRSLIPEDSPPVFYQQRQTCSCILSSLASALYYMGDVYGSEFIIRRKHLSVLAVKEKGWGRMRFGHDVLMGITEKEMRCVLITVLRNGKNA